ncbi:unnamed protein product [Rhizophagus irregularis]|nr:unnamed protein product [Rhizophagus irregularis]
MGKGNDTIVDDKKDDIIIEGKVDVIVEDDVMVEDVEDVEDNIIVDYTNINLQKERENVVKKSYYKQTYANKYFIEEITPELVRCKCVQPNLLGESIRRFRPDIATKELFPEIVKSLQQYLERFKATSKLGNVISKFSA